MPAADANRFSLEGGRDSNADGQVSKAEFSELQGPGENEAFSCLDPDDNGQITRDEMFELKTRFFRSRCVRLPGQCSHA